MASLMAAASALCRHSPPVQWRVPATARVSVPARAAGEAASSACCPPPAAEPSGRPAPAQPQPSTSAAASAILPRGRRGLLLSSAAAAAAAALLPAAPVCARLVEEAVAEAVFSAAAPHVAFIEVLGTSGEQLGVGSGFLWPASAAAASVDRFVVTNAHVVASASRVRLLLGRASVPLDAQVVGLDPAHDIAVLRLSPQGATTTPPGPGLPLASAKQLRVGQSVYAIGAPAGLQLTLTSGVVSGLNRTIPSPAGVAIEGCIQSDAAINAGNSGGPLLDSAGSIVGISTATYTRSGTGSSSGLGFAVPSDTLRYVVPRLIVSGHV